MNRLFVNVLLKKGMPFFVALYCAGLILGCSGSIHDEVSRGNVEQVRMLLERYPELLESKDKMGKTPLFFAVNRGRKELVDLLLNAGADVHAQDITGLTPLHAAAWWNKKEEAERLLAAGASLEQRDVFGDTPLHIAAIQGRTEMVVFLVEKGADLSAQNNDGRTALDLARYYHKEETAQKLQELVTKGLREQ